MSWLGRSSESRNFDCIYDPAFAFPSAKDEQRARQRAILTAREQHSLPKYDMMFAASPRSSTLSFRRHGADGLGCLSERSSTASAYRLFENALRLDAGANNPAERRIHNPMVSAVQCKGKNRNLYFFKPSTNVNVVNVKLSDGHIPAHRDHTRCTGVEGSQSRKKRSATRGTQTLYRESSAQTLAYTPNIRNERRDAETLELFKLPSLLPGDKPPGLYEVERLERARKRWLFAKYLRDQMREQIDGAKAKLSAAVNCKALEAFEWERWIEREEELQECQLMRLELVIRMMDEREKQLHGLSKDSIELATQTIRAKREAGLRRNEVEYKRAIRRLETKRAQKSRVWKKEDLVFELGNPGSEAYAPQQRYGSNPRRRQFTGGRQAFNERIGYLDKVIVNMSNLECPFSKVDQWAKPKGRIQEVEQRFCSDENLKKLYESLRDLRESSQDQKVTPKCLMEKVRHKPYKHDQGGRVQKKEPVTEESEPDHMVVLDDRPLQETSEDWTALDEEVRRKRERADFLLAEVRREELEGLLADYEGSTIGWLMRFLSEEMDRLQELRKLHFITMLAQKERWRREAAEAGLRQKENEMRKVYEEIFRETNESNIEVCESYLDDILMVDTHQYADDEATEGVLNLARLIDSDLQRWMKSWTDAGIQNPTNFDTLRYLLRDIVFPDVGELAQKRETELIVQYIVEDVLFPGISDKLDAYDVATITLNETVDRLLDLDLYYMTSGGSSECPCEPCGECECDLQTREARAIVRKVIRRAVPGRRWFTPIERLGHSTLMDIIDGAVEDGEVNVQRQCDHGTRDVTCPLVSTKSLMNLHKLETESAGESQHHHDEQDANGEPPLPDETQRKLHYGTIDDIMETIDLQVLGPDTLYDDDDDDEIRFSGSLRRIPSYADVVSYFSTNSKTSKVSRERITDDSSSTSDSATSLRIDGMTPEQHRRFRQTERFLHYLLKDVVAAIVPAEAGDSEDSVYISDSDRIQKSVSDSLLRRPKETDSNADVDSDPGKHALKAILNRVDEDISSTDEYLSLTLTDHCTGEGGEEAPEEEQTDPGEEESSTWSISASEMERVLSDRCKCQMERERDAQILEKMARGKVHIHTVAGESFEDEEDYSYESFKEEATDVDSQDDNSDDTETEDDDQEKDDDNEDKDDDDEEKDEDDQEKDKDDKENDEEDKKDEGEVVTKDEGKDEDEEEQKPVEDTASVRGFPSISQSALEGNVEERDKTVLEAASREKPSEVHLETIAGLSTEVGEQQSEVVAAPEPGPSGQALVESPDTQAPTAQDLPGETLEEKEERERLSKVQFQNDAEEPLPTN